jgi:hypothetical protein
MSNVKPAPEQFGVAHIQNPSNPSGSPTTR